MKKGDWIQPLFYFTDFIIELHSTREVEEE